MSFLRLAFTSSPSTSLQPSSISRSLPLLERSRHRPTKDSHTVKSTRWARSFASSTSAPAQGQHHHRRRNHRIDPTTASIARKSATTTEQSTSIPLDKHTSHALFKLTSFPSFSAFRTFVLMWCGHIEASRAHSARVQDFLSRPYTTMERVLSEGRDSVTARDLNWFDDRVENSRLWPEATNMTRKVFGMLNTQLAKCQFTQALEGSLHGEAVEWTQEEMYIRVLRGVTFAEAGVWLGDIEAALLLDGWRRTAWAQTNEFISPDHVAARALMETYLKDTPRDKRDWRVTVARVEHLCRDGFAKTKSADFASSLDLIVEAYILTRAENSTIEDLPAALQSSDWMDFEDPAQKGHEITAFCIEKQIDVPRYSLAELREWKDTFDNALREAHHPRTMYEQALAIKDVNMDRTKWLDGMFSAAADGNPDACWALARYYLQEDGLLPLHAKTDKEIAGSIGAEYAEVAVSLTRNAVTFSNRAVALAALYVMRDTGKSASKGDLMMKRLERAAQDCADPAAAENFRIFPQDYHEAKGTFALSDKARARREDLIEKAFGYTAYGHKRNLLNVPGTLHG